MTEQHFNALPTGYQLQEYTLKSVLGHGGFGITYLAADNNLGKDVAIKEYLPTEFAVRRDDSKVQPRSTADNNDYEWGLDRFMKEAQTLGLFRHPNIVPVYRAFKENGTAYMVMEYQRGQSLAELFRKHRSDFTEEDLLSLVIPLLDGLGVVHKAGYLHRDLKPGNIFIREDGSPVLLDFGAARNAVGRKSKNLTSIVTPGYAPLEQYFADGNQGPWTDIYAMASILYQAVAGRIPPEAPARVKRDPITPAVEAGRGRFGETFLAAIDEGLKVEEEQRPQSVDQWRAMLLGQEVPAAPPPTMGREAASARSSATMLAGHAALAGRGAPATQAGNPTLGGSASMRFPTIGREDALAHQRRGGAGKMAAIAVGVAVLLAASGVGAYIALNPDHGLFGTGTTGADKRGTDTTKISADAETQRKLEEEARRKSEDEARRKAEDERRRAEDEARRKAQDEARRREAEDAKRRAEEERKRREQEEARRNQGEDARRQAEDEKRRAEEERIRRQEEEARRRDEEARREQQRREQEEARRRQEQEEARRREQEEARKREQEEQRASRGVSCDYSVLRGVYAAETDCFYVQRVFQYTLTSARDGANPSTWTNQRSGASGTIRIIATIPGRDMCRRFQQTVTVGGRTLSGTGVACYRNNTWQISS